MIILLKVRIIIRVLLLCAPISKDWAEMRAEFAEMKARWENEKTTISRLQKLREEIEQTNGEIADAERTHDLNKAAELKYGKLPALKKELEDAGYTNMKEFILIYLYLIYPIYSIWFTSHGSFFTISLLSFTLA